MSQQKAVYMQGLTGSEAVKTPSNYQENFKFLSIMNMTDNSVCVYPPNITIPQAGGSVICLGEYMVLTIPIIGSIQDGLSFVFTNPHSTNQDLPKVAQLIWSEENLGYNQSFSPSFTSGGGVVNTAISFDDVGLAKEAKQDTLAALVATATKQDVLINKMTEVLAQLTTGPVPTQITGSNIKVGEDLTAIWLENALINTGVNVDIELPATLQGNAKYLIEIYNPSTVTALTVIAQNKSTNFGGDTRYPELTRWGININSSKCVIIEGFLLDSGGRLILSNDTALGAEQGFSASIRIIKI